MQIVSKECWYNNWKKKWWPYWVNLMFCCFCFKIKINLFLSISWVWLDLELNPRKITQPFNYLIIVLYQKHFENDFSLYTHFTPLFFFFFFFFVFYYTSIDVLSTFGITILKSLGYSSYVRIRDVALKNCQRQLMIGRSGKIGSGISVLAARYDDDDSKVLMKIHLNWNV